MWLPQGATVGAVVPFLVALLIIILFSWFYLSRYRNRYESERSSFVTSVISLTIVMITSALLPVDIFLVSYMKSSNGMFQPWASELSVRESIENSVLYCYYVAYGFVFFCVFIMIPFMYFYYEEKDDDEQDSNDRICTAVKFTSVFVFIASALLLVGAFVPLKPATNSTEWEKIKDMFENLGTDRGEDAISMVLSILCVLGMLNLVFYTAFGMSSWPIGLIRGTSSARIQSEEVQSRNIVIQTRINALRDKERITSRLTPKEKRILNQLEEEERTIRMEEQLVDQHRNSWSYKCRTILRPIEIIVGVFAACLGLVLWVSLLITNIDRDIHSEMKTGYALQNFSLPNPIDLLLVQLQKVFPLDYILILIITWLLVLCTMSGIRNLGIRIFCFKMFKLRKQKTPPQGLLLTCAILMLSVLTFNVFLYTVSPQYTTYGSQHYIKPVVNATDELDIQVKAEVHSCPDPLYPRNCTMTRNSVLLVRFFYKAWYFGAFYHWASWGYLLISGLALLYALIRKSRTVTEGMVDRDDFEESEDRPMVR
ncbi:probable lysosomal cobalamin transporter isoform X1 [Panonychus citri]|uniref:probable lysosomal cobalamin transporter isoform X1 n=1 Tax=Panonychus citri TaxID=50023 RepID=UPI0023077888|nr:probable lysosomal cobalamin transporter isoform X1 [Panonychus citri]